MRLPFLQWTLLLQLLSILPEVSKIIWMVLSMTSKSKLIPQLKMSRKLLTLCKSSLNQHAMLCLETFILLRVLRVILTTRRLDALHSLMSAMEHAQTGVNASSTATFSLVMEMEQPLHGSSVSHLVSLQRSWSASFAAVVAEREMTTSRIILAEASHKQ